MGSETAENITFSFVPFWRKAPGAVAPVLVTLKGTTRGALDFQSHHFAQDVFAAFLPSVQPPKSGWKSSFQLSLTRNLSIERLSRYADFLGEGGKEGEKEGVKEGGRKG